ncbi:MAG: LON peptidase substrate-binding domain-containing protein, partial [Planctomycetota bacterium]
MTDREDTDEELDVGQVSADDLVEMPSESAAQALAQLVGTDEATPSRLHVLPLQKAVPFPGIMMPVQLASDRARAIITKANDQSGFLGLLARKRKSGEAVDPQDPRHVVFDEELSLSPADLYRVGVVAKILKLINLPDGEQAALMQGLKRFRVKRVLRRKPNLIINVQDCPDIPRPGKRTEAQIRNLQQIIKRIVDTSPQLDEQFTTAALNIQQPGHLSDFCAAYLVRDLSIRQRVLESQNLGRRIDIVVESLTRELEILELGARIQDEIRQKIEKAQKEYFLREQIKIIRRELGEEVDSRQAEIERLTKDLEQAGLPEDVGVKAREELGRLEVTPIESPEHTVLRNHLDWIISLPWKDGSDDRRDIRVAAKVLEEDHYGLAQVKERILEFLAVRKLKPGHAGPILCLSGPPGVGKTSLGRSIARAMGRKFWRFSLGGMRDEAEIKGHRRTYVGSMPGRILQGVKQCGTNNPVMMLDEVDKLGADFRGDPSSALLEVLDPEQNHAFIDHYLDVPFDLSKVFFVATANLLDNIPPALRDRMEIIEIPGYVAKEKVEIGRRHLLPKQLTTHG